jgi:hypothetical protein
MNWNKATNKQLKVIAYQTPEASFADQAAACYELFKRGKKRSGKPTMRGKELFKK